VETETAWVHVKQSSSQKFAQMAEDKEKTSRKAQGKEIPQEYKRFVQVFGKEVSERLPKRSSWDHEIKMKQGFKPKVSHPYLLQLIPIFMDLLISYSCFTPLLQSFAYAYLLFHL
jgi:hypothetical protein